MNYKVFFLAFFICLFLQGIRMWQFDMTDTSMWGNQAHYVEVGDKKEFDRYTAYGHPGGPIIEGGILVHSISGLPYETSVEVLLVILGSLFSAGSCLLCWLIWKNHLWWIMATVTLSIDRLYDFVTPPTAIASFLIVLLFLLTWYMYENKKNLKWQTMALWAVTSGLSVSARADISPLVSAFLGGFLLFSKIVDLKKMFYIICGTIAVFVLTDPFMLFMPIQHIKDLLSEIILHYALFYTNHLTFVQVADISLIAFVSVIIGLIITFSEKNALPLVPPSLFTTILFMTIVLYIILLNAKFQSQRYFVPIILIWEILLPLHVFSVVSRIKLIMTEKMEAITRKTLYYGFTGLFTAYHVIFFLYSIWLSYTPPHI